MHVISVPQDFNEEELYVDLRPTLGCPLFLNLDPPRSGRAVDGEIRRGAR
ncbi:hypothetical protein [Streptomyces sp. H27-H5]|nr:hypothetical protein [Streptomyces sp. H27-H5]